MELRPDDPVHDIPYIWHGFKLEGWLADIFKVRGRPLEEWAVLGVAMFVSWQLSGWLAVTVTGESQALWRVAGCWIASSRAAAWVYRNWIESDQPIPYLLRVIGTEAAALPRRWRERPPTDERTFKGKKK